MSAPAPQPGSSKSRPRPGPRRPQKPKANAGASTIPAVAARQISSAVSTSASTPMASGTATPAVQEIEGKVRFRDFQGLSEGILAAIPFEYCTDVQAATLPAVLEGSDILAQAKTGTGKTMAFLVPTVQRLLSTSPPPQQSSTSILVLSPTRELALQIGVAAEGLLKNQQFKVKCVVGGTSLDKDIKDLRNGRADILVATPGRLLDLIDNAGIGKRFSHLQALVLDEADRLLDQGFRRELVKIIEALPPKTVRHRQTLLFSATIPAEVHSIASLALDKDHKFISTLTDEDVNVHEHVIQESLVVPDDEVIIAGAEAIFREQSLAAERGGFKVMAFLPTARSAALMADIFSALPSSSKMPTWEIHSRMSQSARIKAIDQFRVAPEGVMFSSDVMARGIDVKGVTGVVQIGLPANAEQYVHRLGRTARAGSKGHGVVVLGAFESSFLRNKTLATFNISPYTASTASSRSTAAGLITQALSAVPDEAKIQAYQAWIGYYNGNLRALGWSQSDLVAAANAYAKNTLRYGADDGAGWTPPALQAKTVGKMGLKGVKGLNVTRGESGPSRGGNAPRGGGGGGRGGAASGRVDAPARQGVPGSATSAGAPGGQARGGGLGGRGGGMGGRGNARGGRLGPGAGARDGPPHGSIPGAQRNFGTAPGGSMPPPGQSRGDGEPRGVKRARGGPQGGRGGGPRGGGMGGTAAPPRAAPQTGGNDEFGGW